MKTLKAIIFTILCIICICCKKEPVSASSKVILTTFTELPADIDGCACLFSETEKQYDRKEYVVVTNLDSTAYIAVNHKIIKLKLIAKTIAANAKDNENYTAIFTNSTYKATIEITEDTTKKNDSEVWWNKGTLKVEDKNGNEQTKKFIGECGC